MTRFLSEALEAKEPYFRQGLTNLEASNGNPSTDIRFSHEIMNNTAKKLNELGLDPKDTTPKELFEALKQRAKEDDLKLVKYLRTLAANNVSAEAEPVAGMAEALKNHMDSKACYGLKPSRVKSILKVNPPKKAMKKLGYRSIDSMLKHEAMPLIYTVATLYESPNWYKKLLEQYRQLKSSDFEEKSIAVLHPVSKRWREISASVIKNHRHNLIAFKELGAIVLLPFNEQPPAGVVTSSLCLSLHEINEIRAYSTFIKLNQLRPDFGEIVGKSILNEPELNSELLDKPMPWNLMHRYLLKLSDQLKDNIFEPYVQLEDIAWKPIEKTLSQIEPSLAFWSGTSHLGIVAEHKPLSLNIIDNALNLCNLRSYETRIAHHFKRSLWQELLLRYFKQRPVEAVMMAELNPELALEAVT